MESKGVIMRIKILLSVVRGSVVMYTRRVFRSCRIVTTSSSTEPDLSEIRDNVS